MSKLHRPRGISYFEDSTSRSGLFHQKWLVFKCLSLSSLPQIRQRKFSNSFPGFSWVYLISSWTKFLPQTGLKICGSWKSEGWANASNFLIWWQVFKSHFLAYPLRISTFPLSYGGFRGSWIHSHPQISRKTQPWQIAKFTQARFISRNGYWDCSKKSKMDIFLRNLEQKLLLSHWHQKTRSHKHIYHYRLRRFL